MKTTSVDCCCETAVVVAGVVVNGNHEEKNLSFLFLSYYEHYHQEEMVVEHKTRMKRKRNDSAELAVPLNDRKKLKKARKLDPKTGNSQRGVCLESKYPSQDAIMAAVLVLS
jgi:hypothetical protein